MKRTNGPWIAAAALLGCTPCGHSGEMANAVVAVNSENLALRAESKALDERVAALRNECAALEGEVRTLSVSAALLDGSLDAPPAEAKTGPVLVFEDGVAAPVHFDCSVATLPNKDVHLRLEGGARYRVEGEVRAENCDGGSGPKFGAFVKTAGGAKRWPGVKTGLGSFDWQKVSFEETLPFGASFMVSYGPGGCTGKIWFRNIRVWQLSGGIGQ